MTRKDFLGFWTCVTLLLAASVASLGCLPLASNLMRAAGADLIPPEYDQLSESRVAVITVTDASQYSQDVVARDMSRLIRKILRTELDEVTLVREDEIDQWRDVHGWESIDYAAMGRAVKADKLIVIELTGLQLREGATLYRGRSNTSVEVIDVATGGSDYERHLEDFTYPRVAGQPTSETSETKFRRLYLSMLATEIGRLFHPYDMTERFAADSAIASF